MEEPRTNTTETAETTWSATRSIAQRVRRAGLVDESVLNWAVNESRLSGRGLHELLAERVPGAETPIWRIMAEYLGVAFDDLSERHPNRDLAQRLPSHLAFSRNIVPLSVEAGVLTVAVAHPETLGRLDEISALTGMEIAPVLSGPNVVSRFIRDMYGLGAETVEELVAAAGETESPIKVLSAEAHTIDEKLDSDQQASITQFVNELLIHAIEDQASDIHIEPYERQLRVRFRIDGQLQEISVPPTTKQLEPAIISRLKVLADMDIAEKRLCQDGQMRLMVLGRPIDVRVSVLPSIYGESIVLRILDRQTQFRRLEEIGMSPAILAGYRDLLGMAQGLILVTGPTGSGKTTTLYGSLNYVNRPRRKIITIEDPVEYRLEGITQIQVKDSIGLSFGTLLRNIVRHDPDVLMIGEIRDLDTASMALNAAMTGHLVFSTLHTNDAPSAVARLVNMGAPPYLIAASTKVVLAQRLVRMICPDCRQPVTSVPDELLKEFPALEGRPLFRGAGCEGCHYTGYRGRTGVFEFLVANEEVASLVLESAPTSALRACARDQGMVPLQQAGIDLVLAGRTSIDEVYRVTRDVSGRAKTPDGGPE